MVTLGGGPAQPGSGGRQLRPEEFGEVAAGEMQAANARAARRFQVRLLVADHDRAGEIYRPLGKRAQDHAWVWLAVRRIGMTVDVDLGLGMLRAVVVGVDAGADLVQIYTGLIYEGPELVKACAQALKLG